MDLHALSDRRLLTRWWWISAVVFVACLARLSYFDQRLVTPESSLGVLSLQFAGTADSLNEILRTWQGMGVMGIARASLLTDFVFMVAYGVNFAVACLLLAGTRPVGWRMAGIALGCIPLDAAENILQLIMLTAVATSTTAGLNLLFVICKFTLVVATIAFLLKELIRVVEHRLRGA